MLNGETARHRGLGHREHWEWCKAWHAALRNGLYQATKPLQGSQLHFIPHEPYHTH